MAYQQRCEIAILTDTTALLHGGVVGLSLRPSKTKGHGTWVIRYVSPVTAKHRNADLGSYPQIGIAQAGKLGIEFYIQLKDGLDPLEEKAKQESQAKFAKAIPMFQETVLSQSLSN